MRNKIILITGIICICGIAIMAHTYPIIMRLALGKARMIGTPVQAEISINNNVSHSAKVFYCDSDFSFQGNGMRNLLILYLPNLTKSDARNILIIDREDKQIKIPNSNKRDYEVILGRLFQSDTGLTMFSITDPIKGDPGFMTTDQSEGDPTHLKIEDSIIEFDLPNWSEYQIKSVKIKMT